MLGQNLQKFFICSDSKCQMDRTVKDWNKLADHINQGHKVITKEQLINGIINLHKDTLGFCEKKMLQFKEMINEQFNKWTTSLINQINKFVDLVYQKSEIELYQKISDIIQRHSKIELEQLDILSYQTLNVNNIEKLISLYNKNDPYNSCIFEDSVNNIQNCIEIYLEDFQSSIERIINKKTNLNNYLFQQGLKLYLQTTQDQSTQTNINEFQSINQNQNYQLIDLLTGFDSNQSTISNQQIQRNSTPLKGYKNQKQQQQFENEQDAVIGFPLKGYKKRSSSIEKTQQQINLISQPIPLTIQTEQKSDYNSFLYHSNIVPQQKIEITNQLQQQIPNYNNFTTQPQTTQILFQQDKEQSDSELYYEVDTINYLLSDKHIKHHSESNFSISNNSALVIFELQLEREESSQLSFTYEFNNFESNQFCVAGILDYLTFMRENLRQKKFPNTYCIDTNGVLCCMSKRKRTNLQLEELEMITIQYKKNSEMLSFESQGVEQNVQIKFKQGSQYFYFIYFGCSTIEIITNQDDSQEQT